MDKAIFIGDMPGSRIDMVYPPDLKERIAAMTQLHPDVIGRHNFRSAETAPVLREAEIAFSTWGMACFSEEEIAECMPNLKSLLYGAGSVQAFARPFLNRGIRI